MIYRDQIFKNKSFHESDLIKNCHLINCEINGALLDNCTVYDQKEPELEPVSKREETYEDLSLE